MAICIHLKPLLDFELLRGNKIKEVSQGWSIAKLVIDMRDSLDHQGIEQNVQLPNCVRKWENTDSHYPVQAGYICDVCKNSIAGPL